MTNLFRRKKLGLKGHSRGCCHHHQTDESGKMIPVLSEFPTGSKCKVVSLMGHMMNKRLANMGLGVGSEIEVIKNDPSGGPLIIYSASVRIALGRGMARHICCKEIENE